MQQMFMITGKIIRREERDRRKANGGRISRKHNLSKTDDNHKIGKDTVEERGREKNKNDQNHKSDRVET